MGVSVHLMSTAMLRSIPPFNPFRNACVNVLTPAYSNYANRVTSCLQIGHRLLRASQFFTHTRWNTCPHGSAYASSCSSSMRQMEHSFTGSSSPSSPPFDAAAARCSASCCLRFSFACSRNIWNTGRRFAICSSHRLIFSSRSSMSASTRARAFRSSSRLVARLDRSLL